MPSGVEGGEWHMFSLGRQVTGQPVDLGAQLSGPLQASPVQSGGGVKVQWVSSSAQVTGQCVGLQ